jgi:ubiquinone/menaquinone biosynthesis C-methylase UbiE
MLHRVLEPEVMDSPEEARDYDSMDHTTVNRVFVTDFLEVWDRGSPVLDVGTGTAQIPIELARQHPVVHIVGVDLAEHMLQLGRENIRRANWTDRIRLDRCDAKKLGYPDGSFAAVISNSIVHHIPEPDRVLTEMLRVVRTGGNIFVRDLLRPPDQATLQKLVQTYAGTANDHQRQMFADSLHAALTLAEVQNLVLDRGCNPLDVRQTSDRHWTWATRK